MEFIVILTTFDDMDLARKVAKILVEEKLAACVQIANIESFYTWKGKVEDAKEFLCIIKTKKNLYELAEKRIKELHTYEVPQIVAVPIVKGSEDYLSWFEKETR